MGTFGRLAAPLALGLALGACEGKNPALAEDMDAGVAEDSAMSDAADAQQDAMKPVLPEGCELLLVEELCSQTGALAIKGTDNCCPPDFVSTSSCNDMEDCHCCVPVAEGDAAVDQADADAPPEGDGAMETPDAGVKEEDAAVILVDAAIVAADADNTPRAEVCGDGIDNDDNRLTDCFDPRCAAETAVAVDFVPGTEVTLFGQLPLIVQQEITASLSCEEMVQGFELGFLVENLGGQTQIRVHNNVMGVGVGIWHFANGEDPFFQNAGQAPAERANTVVNNGLYTAPNDESFEGHFPVALPR